MQSQAPSHQASNKWAIQFKDTNPPNNQYVDIDDNTNLHYMEQKLKKVFEGINKSQNSGQISTTDIYLVQKQDENEVNDYVFWAFIDSSGPPFNYRFFEQKEGMKNRGALRFQDEHLKILQVLKGLKAESYIKTLEEYQPLSKMSTENQKQKKDILEKCAIQGPEMGDIDFKNATKEVLLKEFKTLWRLNQIKDVHEYANRLEKIGYEKAFQTVISDPVPFERMQRSQVKENPIETLQRFVQDSQTSKKKEQYEFDIRKSGHENFIDRFVDYCILVKEQKRGAVWLWGQSNTGKSTLLKMLQKIFTITSFIQTKTKFDINYAESNIAPQFVTIDEGAYNTFFADKRLWNDAKLVFEKEGYVCENKYKNAAVKWKGLPIIVTSNRLPYILSEHAANSIIEQDRYDHLAFKNRIFFEKLTEQHKNSEIFPYDISDLAQYLIDRVNKISKEEGNQERDFREISREDGTEFHEQQLVKPEPRTHINEIIDINKSKLRVPPILGFNNYNLLQKRLGKQQEKLKDLRNENRKKQNINELEMDFKMIEAENENVFQIDTKNDKTLNDKDYWKKYEVELMYKIMSQNTREFLEKKYIYPQEQQVNYIDRERALIDQQENIGISENKTFEIFSQDIRQQLEKNDQNLDDHYLRYEEEKKDSWLKAFEEEVEEKQDFFVKENKQDPNYKKEFYE